jgi:hypothetical protein
MRNYMIFWVAPVHIRTSDGRSIPVDGPHQAVEMLDAGWPDKTGEHYGRAVRECNLACHVNGCLDSSRETFVAAALEARVLVPHHSARGGRLQAATPVTASATPHGFGHIAMP